LQPCKQRTSQNLSSSSSLVYATN